LKLSINQQAHPLLHDRLHPYPKEKEKVNTTDCPTCPLKKKCTKAEFRTVSRDPREHLLKTMRQRIKTEKGEQMKKDRSTTVEPTFGNAKYNKKFTHFLLRTKEKATIEFTLLCIALNIEKIFIYLTSHQIDLATALNAVT